MEDVSAVEQNPDMVSYNPYDDNFALQDPRTAGSSINQNPDFMRFLFEFKETINKLYYRWKGYIYDVDQGKYFKPKECYPIMNDAGIDWGISLIDSYTNQIHIVSNYNEKYFNGVMREVSKEIINSLCMRYEEFNLKKTDILRVANEIEHKIQAILLGGRNDGYRQFFSRQYRVSENISKYDDDRALNRKPNLGVLSFLNNAFRREPQNNNYER